MSPLSGQKLSTPAGILLLVLSLAPFCSKAQFQVKARLDTTKIRIGEQPTLTLSLEYKKEKQPSQVSFPRVGKMLGDKVELVEKSPIDTIVPFPDNDPDRRRLIQSLKLTSFDSGYHRIPALPFTINGDTLKTDPLLFVVKGVELGKNPKPRPIKGIHRFPYTWKAWFQDNWHWFATAGGILLLALLLFLYYRYRKRKNETAPPVPVRPPHEIALERLDRLRTEKAWEGWGSKPYYTELTDILRHYLESRYRIPALEETTPRILHELAFTDIDDEGKGEVRKILKTADMVKFAKQRPTSAECQRSLEEAIAFVKRSIPSADSQAEQEKGMEGG
ncbi:MAG: LPXTG cell wall anchor domain-containing protein [Flavobacteriales bacterium]